MTLASVVMYLWGKDVGGARVGFWSGTLVNAVPILNVFFVYMSTDPASILFWALTLWLVYRAVFWNRQLYWYLFGIALGLAMMTKFLNWLTIPAVGLFLICSKRYRGLLKRKEPYLAGVIALVVLSPFIWWNARHGWATFYFNLAGRQALSINPLHVIEFIGGQALVVSPLLFAGSVYVIYMCWRDGLGKGDDLHLFLAALCSVTLGIFLLMSFFRSIGAHWPAAGYLTACTALPYFVVVEGNSLLRRYAGWAIVTAIALVVISYSALFITYFAPSAVAGAVARCGGQAAELYEMHGYREIAGVAEERAAETDAIVLTPSYAFCSMLSFYSPSQIRTHMFGEGAIHGLNYRFWDGDFSEYIGRNALWVYKEPPKLDDIDRLKKSFERVGGIEEYEYRLGGKTVRTFYLVQCENLTAYGGK
jgi:4-amino-4-deoxy-L-arabinose transferase-like glycosyltransferase